jgi:hypothetical protein
MTYNNVDCIHVFLILACLVSAATSHMRDTLLAHFTRPALGQVFMVFCICFNNVPKSPTHDVATHTDLKDKLRPWSEGWCSRARDLVI